MTNLCGEPRQVQFQWLSPERAVLVLPVLAGLAMAVLIVPAVVWPISARLNNQQEDVELLRGKSLALRQLRRQLSELSARQLLREQQLDRLLALVAGTSELNTFLAELNDLAYSNGVVITTTEPGEVQRFVPPIAPVGEADAAPPAAGGTGASPSSVDHILMKGLEKRSAGLTVQGGFLQVFGFLRALERLQVFVIVSELDIQSEDQSSAENNVVVPEVKVSLKLSAYGRQTNSAGLVKTNKREDPPKEIPKLLFPS